MFIQSFVLLQLNDLKKKKKAWAESGSQVYFLALQFSLETKPWTLISFKQICHWTWKVLLSKMGISQIQAMTTLSENKSIRPFWLHTEWEQCFWRCFIGRLWEIAIWEKYIWLWKGSFRSTIYCTSLLYRFFGIW